MNKVIKNIIGWILYFSVLIGLIIGIPKGLTYALDTSYPMASITSGSMWPELKKGDLVLIKGIKSKEEIKIGDIIVYRSPSLPFDKLRASSPGRLPARRVNSTQGKLDSGQASSPQASSGQAPSTGLGQVQKGLTIHRVIGINEATVITKGDANNISDPPVKYEDIIGKTVTFNNKPLRIPMLGNISILINRGRM